MGKGLSEKWGSNTCGNIDSWGHCWEPRSKTISAFCFIIGIVSLKTLWLVVLALIFVCTAAVSMRLPVKFLLGRLLWVMPFIAFMGITLVIGGGFPLNQDRLVFAGLICFKALTSVLVMIITMGTQPLRKYLDGLANMSIPPLVVTILFLAYRYIFLFHDKLKGTQKAIAARNFQPRAGKKSLKVYGEITGGLLIKAVDHSDAVHKSMLARGFDDRLYTSRPAPVTWTDIVKSSAVLVITLLIVLAEWGSVY